MLRLASAAALLLLAAPAFSQTFGQVEDRRSTSRNYFVHVLTGEATIVVSVWGTVPAPGTYEVGDGASLGDVLSLAGGPLLPTLQQISDTDITREIRVRLYRPGPTGRAMVYDRTVEEMVADADAYPVLLDGDVIEVTTTENIQRRWTWRDSAQLGSVGLSALVALTQIAILVTR